MKQLVRVGARGNDHSSIGAAPEYTLVVHDVLRVILFMVGATVGVFVLVLMGHYSRVRRETVASLILQHSLNLFIKINN